MHPTPVLNYRGRNDHYLRPFIAAPRQRGTVIAEHTGPLEVLQGHRILMLADVENLSFSAQNRLGYQVSYGALAKHLIAATSSCALHAFFSVQQQESGAHSAYFEARGWTTHHRPIEIVRTKNGGRKRANIDNHLLFHAGVLCSRSRADTVVLASGDGDLVCDLARALSELPAKRQIVTLSLAGSTSWRLNAQQNPWIAANIELGHDCLRPLYQN